MKLRELFLITHGLSGAILAAVVYASSQWSSQAAVSAALASSIGTLCLAVWYATRRMKAGLRVMETVASDHQSRDVPRTGVFEFDQIAQRLGKQAAGWETIASATRQQARDFQSMIQMLDQRSKFAEPSFEDLRGILVAIGSLLRSQLDQLETGTTDVEQCAKVIADSTEAQSGVVIRTAAQVEQLSSSIDLVSENAVSSRTAIVRTGESASESLTLIRELIEGLDRIRSQSLTCEKKLGGLGDPTKQISSIVDTIGDIAARTELLALNASIESIRAGEHGRGFAVVADEVRKLAEQATGATREISSLIDSIQLVTQESIGVVLQQREQVETEVQRASGAETVLIQICRSAAKDTAYADQISESSSQQLNLARQVVAAVEQISELVNSNRRHAETACWTIKSLAQTAPEINSTIDRLRNCGQTPTAIPVPDTSMTIPNVESNSNISIEAMPVG